MYDAALFYADSLNTSARCRRVLGDDISNEFVLATVHRAENTDNGERLKRIFGALKQTARTTPVVIPLHPRTKKALQQADMLQEVKEALCVIARGGCLDMISLERQAQLIVTDSGGVQKEAYFQETPCVTLRDETEWTELVEAGCNTIVPPKDEVTMVAEIKKGVESGFDADRYIYGDGSASETIVDIVQAL